MSAGCESWLAVSSSTIGTHHDHRESGPAQTIDSVLERIGRAVEMSELERAWCEGLRCHRDHGDRDRILAEAGARLDVFDEAAAKLCGAIGFAKWPRRSGCGTTSP